ncbi:MAG: ABC transporter permease [Acidimicrobiia bacterium]|nr:ABC transporter permease [Acidimicrobiia bacterium]NDF30612.1 ABC transporter permease [Acidimicrobiia bacterium]
MSSVDSSAVDTAAVASSAVASSGNVSTKKRSRFDLRIVLPPVLTGGLILGIWYFVSYVILDPKRRFLLKPPHEVWSVGFANGDNFSEMMEGLLATSKTAFWGLLSAILLGFLLAVIMSQAKFVERAIFPYAVVLQAIPILAIVPLIGFWFGYGFMPRVFICVIIALFPIIVNTLFGLLSADQGLHDLLTLHNTGRVTRLRKLMFPAALPAVFAGLRISAGLSVIGAIVGDFYFGQGEVGIGQLLKRYAARLEGEQLLAAVIVSSGLGVLVFTLFGWIANRVVGKWAADSRGN